LILHNFIASHATGYDDEFNDVYSTSCSTDKYIGNVCDDVVFSSWIYLNHDDSGKGQALAGDLLLLSDEQACRITLAEG